MMRVIFLLLVSSIAFQSNSQTWNNYLQKRFKSYGIWADSILLVPNDTSLNKTGFAIKGSTAYIGDGVKWTAITGGNAGAYDSLLKLNNTWLGVNKFNRQIEVDSLKGAGTLYITGNLETSDDIKAGRRLQAGKSLVRNGIFRFYNFNHNYRTDLQGDSMLTSNVDLLLPSSSGKLALTTDIAPVDTTVVKTVVSARNDSLVLTAAINSKPNFGDVRDIVADSLNYVRGNFVDLISNQNISGRKTFTREIEVGENNIYDGAINFKNSSNSGIGRLKATTITSGQNYELPNESGTIALRSDISDSLANVVKYADTASMLIPYVTKSTTQTITGYKTYDTGIVIRANNQDSTLDINKSLILKNGTSAALNTIKMPPAIIFDGNAYQSDANTGGFLQNQSNNVRWKIENLPKTGNANSNTFNSYLDFSYSLNNGAWNRKMRLGMFGLEADISSNTLNLGGSGQNGVINLYRAAGGGAQISATSSAGIAMYSPSGLYLYLGSFYITDGQPTNGTKITQQGTYITNYNAANGTPPSGGLQVVGKTILSGLATNYRYINDSSYTLTTTTKQINVAATTKNVYINLLTSVGNGGQEWSVRRESDTNQYKVIIKPTSGQKINGADSLILFAQNNNVTLKSDGANYIIVDRYNTAKANTPAAAEDLSNISSVTPKKRIYTQTDSVVSVTEYYEVTLTTAGNASSFAVKTPIPTTFTSVYDAIGVGAVTIVDDFTTPTTRKSASAVITSVNASNKVLVQLNDDADSGNTKRIVTLNYQYILK